MGLAAYVMSIQLASFVGSNIFTARDKPRYKRPFLICAGCVLAAAVVALVWKALYRLVPQRAARAGQQAADEAAEERKQASQQQQLQEL